MHSPHYLFGSFLDFNLAKIADIIFRNTGGRYRPPTPFEQVCVKCDVYHQTRQISDFSEQELQAAKEFIFDSMRPMPLLLREGESMDDTTVYARSIGTRVYELYPEDSGFSLHVTIYPFQSNLTH